MQDHNISRDKAVAMIDRMDRNRACWARLVLGLEWDDSSLYDVVLNLDYISIPSAVSTIAQMSLLDEFKMDDNTRQSLEDLLVSSRVWAALDEKSTDPISPGADQVPPGAGHHSGGCRHYQIVRCHPGRGQGRSRG